MSVLISSIYFSPVKSLSFTSIKSCVIKKDLGIVNDRSFAFSRIIDSKKAFILEKNPSERELNNFLTLKNSPVLNKYNFEYKNNKLILKLGDKELLSIIADDPEQKSILVNKILELENSLAKPIFLLQSNVTPFFDTSHSNKIFNLLAKAGILVRKMNNYGIKNSLRVTIGKSNDNKKFILKLKKVINV